LSLFWLWMITRVYKPGGGGSSDSSSPSRLFEDLPTYNCCANNLTHFGSVRLETLVGRFSGYALKLWPFVRRSAGRVSPPVNPSSLHRPRGLENTTLQSSVALRTLPRLWFPPVQKSVAFNADGRQIGLDIRCTRERSDGDSSKAVSRSSLGGLTFPWPALCRVAYDWEHSCWFFIVQLSWPPPSSCADSGLCSFSERMFYYYYQCNRYDELLKFVNVLLSRNVCNLVSTTCYWFIDIIRVKKYILLVWLYNYPYKLNNLLNI